MLDYQTRIPVANFRLNGGEKGLIYNYQSDIYNTEIWMAFYGPEDYQLGNVAYSDLNNQLDVIHYDLDLDLRDNKKVVRLLARVQSEVKVGNLRAVSFSIGEGLGEFESERLKKQLRLQKARLGGNELSFAQEDWEGGFTVFLSDHSRRARSWIWTWSWKAISCTSRRVYDCHYPRSMIPGFLVTAISTAPLSI